MIIFHIEKEFLTVLLLHRPFRLNLAEILFHDLDYIFQLSGVSHKVPWQHARASQTGPETFLVFLVQVMLIVTRKLPQSVLILECLTGEIFTTQVFDLPRGFLSGLCK